MHFSISATISAALLATNVAAQLPNIRIAPLPTLVPSSSVGTPVFYSTTLLTSTRTTTIKLSTSSTSISNSTISRTSSASSTASVSPTSIPGLTADQQQALDLHNAARKQVGCAPLTWDATLAKDAQTYANTLGKTDVMAHDPTNGSRNQGENLYYQYGSSSPAYSAATGWWLAEKPYYSGQPIPQNSRDGSSFSKYGHYTQAVWKTTTKVGIAFANSASGKTFVVARYSPAGNVVGSTPF